MLLLVLAPAAFAGWEFTPAGDQQRNWGATETTTVGYDDNFNAQQSHPETGLRVGEEVLLRASIPMQRLFLAGSYDFHAISSRSAVSEAVDLSHNLTASANYTASPRLTLGLTENYVNTLQPGAILGPANTSISLVDGGQYTYDAVSGTLNYSLTERWSVSCSGSWDIWQYEEQQIAVTSDHQDYGASVSATYALDPRTSAGLNYQWSENVFVNPGFQAGLDADSHTAFLSLVRRFNPQLSMTLNGGYTVRYPENGQTSSSPSALGQVTYNYGPSSTLSLTVAESLSASSLGVDRQYSSQQNTSLAVDLNHQVTTRLHALVDVTYVYSQFKNSIAGFSSSPDDQALTFHLGLNYAFRDWASLVLDYYYTQLSSSDDTLVQPYTRNQINVGTSLTY